MTDLRLFLLHSGYNSTEMFLIFIIPKKADLYPPDRSPTDLGARIANRNLSCAQSLTCTHSDLGARKNRVLTWVCTQVTQVTTWEHPSLVAPLADDRAEGARIFLGSTTQTDNLLCFGNDFSAPRCVSVPFWQGQRDFVSKFLFTRASRVSKF